MHLRAVAVRHRGPGLDRALPDPRAERRGDHDLRRRQAGARRALRRRPARAYDAAIRAPEKVAGRAYNIGGGPDFTTSLLEFVDHLRERRGARRRGHPRRVAAGRPAGLHQRHPAGGSRPRLEAAARASPRARAAARLARDYAASRCAIVFADAAGFTPSYDHELAAALARAGAEVELVTSRFRFAESSYPADGYTRSEVFYPFSSRVFRRSKLRIPVKAIEHPFGMARLLAKPRDVLHVQWFAAPPIDDVLFRARGPKVFTAHDLLPRRSVRKTKMWRRLFSRFDRIVVHSQRGFRDARRLRRARGEAARDPDAALPERPAAARRRAHAPLPRADPAVQGPRRRDRGGEAGGGRAAARRRRGARAARALPRGRRVARRSSGAPSTRPSRRSTTRSRSRRSRSSRTSRRSTCPPRSCARWARACRRSSTTSAASPSRCASSAPAAWSSPATSTGWPRRSASCSATRPRSRRPGRVRGDAREALTWEASAAAHLELYRDLV